MKTLRIHATRGQTEPRTYYRLFIYQESGAEKPEHQFLGNGGDDFDKTIPLAMVMRYLHNHPVEPVAVDSRIHEHAASDLKTIIDAHNAAIPEEYREK